MTGRLKVYDADIPGWKYVDAGSVGTVPVIRRVYTADATWSKPVGVAYIEVEVVGGGGSGGGSAATAAGQAGAPGGGGGGGYAKKLLTAADLAGLTTAAVVVGAGGVGVSAGTAMTAGRRPLQARHHDGGGERRRGRLGIDCCCGWYLVRPARAARQRAATSTSVAAVVSTAP